MFTIATLKTETKKNNFPKPACAGKLEKLLSIIEKYDPEFVFLPAYCVARRFGSKEGGDCDFREFFNRMCDELEIESGDRRRKIYKLAVKIYKRTN